MPRRVSVMEIINTVERNKERMRTYRLVTSVWILNASVTLHAFRFITEGPYN